MTQVNKVRDEKGNIARDSNEIQKIVGNILKIYTPSN
jgi:hypothetical protein